MGIFHEFSTWTSRFSKRLIQEWPLQQETEEVLRCVWREWHGAFRRWRKTWKQRCWGPLQIICWILLMCIFQSIIQPSPQVDPDEVEFSRLGKARVATESEDESEKEAQATKVNTVQKDIWSILCWGSVVTASQSKSQQENLWYFFLEQHHFKNPQLVSMTKKYIWNHLNDFVIYVLLPFGPFHLSIVPFSQGVPEVQAVHWQSSQPIWQDFWAHSIFREWVGWSQEVWSQSRS